MEDKLTELIKLNRNLVAQNNMLVNQNSEIINLLKKLVLDEDIEVSDEVKLIFDSALGAGEVYFIEDLNIFKGTYQNNELTVDNLNGSATSSGNNLVQLIAGESLKRNTPLSDSTVILGSGVNEKIEKLPETLKIAIENGAKKVFLPLASSMDLLGAPQELMTLLELVFYKDSEDALNKIF